MTRSDLTAAVARLRDYVEGDGFAPRADVATVLAALDAAQAGQPAPSAEPRDACHHLRQRWRLDMRSGTCVDCGALITDDGVCAPSAEPPAADDLVGIEHRAREITRWEFLAKDYLQRAERAERELSLHHHEEWTKALAKVEAERDALREVVRAADAMRAREHAHDGKTRGCVACSVIAAYDERRAKWKDNT